MGCPNLYPLTETQKVELYFADVKELEKRRLAESDNDFYEEEVFEFTFGDGMH